MAEFTRVRGCVVWEQESIPSVLMSHPLSVYVNGVLQAPSELRHLDRWLIEVNNLRSDDLIVVVEGRLRTTWRPRDAGDVLKEICHAR